MSSFTDTKWTGSGGPEATPDILFDMAADCLRVEAWALEEATRDDTHPNDRDQYEDEAGKWALAAKELTAAGDRLQAAFAPKPRVKA